jgi:RHS repeat-associated protein
VVAVTDSNGNVVESYTYDPYGNATEYNGQGQVITSDVVPNPFRYIGAVWDSATGLYKMGDRYYDPSMDQFTQEDPLGGGYGYASGDPVNRSDPSGLDPDVPCTQSVSSGADGELGCAGTGGGGGGGGSDGPPEPPEAKCSFSAGTVVSTPAGEVHIGSITVGDEVYAYNPSTGTTGVYPVTAVLRDKDAVIEYLTIGGETLTTTPNHPFYTQERGWVPAGKLWKGAHLREEDGGYAAVDGLRLVRRATAMFNLTVKVAHTYYVGRSQSLVHNTCEKPPKPVRTPWGWTGSASWRAAVRIVAGAYRTARTFTLESVEGVVPTEQQALALIKEAGGENIRVEGGHEPPNPHSYPHINYTLPGGIRGTVRIRP